GSPFRRLSITWKRWSKTRPSRVSSWEVLPPEWGWFFDPRLPFDEEVGIPAVAPLITWQIDGIEQIEDQTFYRLTGLAQGEQIRWWTAGLMGEGEVPVTLWVDTGTFRIHRVVMIENETDPERPTQWTIEFSAYDEPIDIQAPPVTE
ncbi:MAG: LppX_LprAFG lipoprotein, partial [Chloroflexota bacterium]